MIVIFLGAPGTGKGTISAELVKKGWIQFSTGEVFRSLAKQTTPLALKVKKTIEGGNLISDDMTNEIVTDALNKYNLSTDRIILDGYPRTIEQANFLNKFLENENYFVDEVIYFYIDQETLLKRLTGRRICPSCHASYNIYFLPPKVQDVCDVCGEKLVKREDDNEENVKVRIKSYNELTKPLINYYKEMGMITEIQADDEIENIVNKVEEVIG